MNRLTDVVVGYGLDDVTILEVEVDQMWGVLLGRHDPPHLPQSPFLALQEIAVAYLGRALEMDTQILRRQREPKDSPEHVATGSALQKFRTGDLANFIILCRKAADLGSRRMTELQMLHSQSTTGSY